MRILLGRVPLFSIILLGLREQHIRVADIILTRADIGTVGVEGDEHSLDQLHLKYDLRVLSVTFDDDIHGRSKAGFPRDTVGPAGHESVHGLHPCHLTSPLGWVAGLQVLI